MNLLVVEDDPDIAALPQLLAAGLDAEVRIRAHADDITEGDVGWCDVVLADFRLPDIDGCQVLAMFEQVRPTVRRIMWSASADARDCPAAQYRLTKPVSMVDLAAVLRG